VFLADTGRTNLAFQSYAAAREICPDNISALLNQDLLILHGFKTDQAPAIAKALDRLEPPERQVRNLVAFAILRLCPNPRGVYRTRLDVGAVRLSRPRRIGMRKP